MRNPDREQTFRFKQFEVINRLSGMKVGTDGVLLGAWAVLNSSTDSTLKLLDIGTGSGVIALMLAQRFPQAVIDAVEIDREAASEAELNFSNSPWSDRLTILNGDITDPVIPLSPASYNLIISNPPFFTNGIKSDNDGRRTARHENGLTLEVLFAVSARLLKPQGKLSLVLPYERCGDIESLAVIHRFSLSRLTEISTVATRKPKRILAELTYNPESATVTPTGKRTLTISDGAGGYTPEYIKLLKDFYLKF